MNGIDEVGSVIELTTIIKRYLTDLAKLQVDLKLNRELHNDAFENDAGYAKEEEKVKAATRERNIIKQQIVKKPEVETLLVKIRQLREEIKAAQEALSGYLSEYQRVTGVSTIEDDQGEVLQIVSSFRLKKKSKFNP